MRIHSLTIDNVRAIEHLELTGLPETGVVVIHGDNEQGKSTIMDAFGAVLNLKHSSSSKDIKQLAPAHRDEAPEVTANLTIGPVTLTIHKRWLKKKSSELTVHSPSRANYTGAEADLKLDEIIAEHLDKTLLEALFLRQGDLGDAVKAAGIPSLQRALTEGQDGDVVDAAEDDFLMAAVEREYQRFYTPAGKENKVLSNARRDRERAASEFADAEGQLRALQSYVDQVERHEQAREADAADLPEARAQLAAAEGELTAAKEAESGATLVRGEAERARQSVKSAQRLLAEREELAEESAEVERGLSAVADELAAAREKAEQQQERVAELGAALEAAKQLRTSAVERVKSSRRTVTLLEDAAARDELAGVVERLETLEDTIASVRARAAGRLVSEDDVRATEKAVQDLEVERRIRDTAVPRLELTSEPATTVSVDGVDAEVASDAVRVDLREGTELRIGDVTALYRAGKSTGASADEAVERAEATLGDLLAELNCADLGEVRAQREEAKTLADTLSRLEEQRRELLAGRSADDVRARAAHLAEQLADVDIPDLNVDTARAEVTAAETARDGADQEVDKADGALATWRDSGADRELVKIQANHDNAAERAQVVAAKLASLEAELPLAALHAQLAAAEDTAAAAEEQLRSAQARVAEADPEGKQATVNASKARVDSLTGRIKIAEVELARLDGYITQAAGAAERLEKAKAADEAMKRELGTLERRANAAARLREVLRRHRDEARKRYAQPFADELTRLAKTVFGPEVEFDLTENLAIRARTLGGATVPLDSLSGGAKEQLAILTRFAIASLVSGEGAGVGVPVIVDDALGSTDPGRLQRMGQLFGQMGRESQVIVLTCFPQRYDWVNPKTEYPIEQLKAGR